MFADDVSLYVTGTTINEVLKELQRITDEASKWYTEKKLSINITKSNSMLVGTKYNLAHYNTLLNTKIASTPLQQVNSTRYLGVHIDDTLSWSKHVQAICKSVSFQLSKLKHLSKFVNSELLNTTYHTSI